jgi:hypothetical protein
VIGVKEKRKKKKKLAVSLSLSAFPQDLLNESIENVPAKNIKRPPSSPLSSGSLPRGIKYRNYKSHFITLNLLVIAQPFPGIIFNVLAAAMC